MKTRCRTVGAQADPPLLRALVRALATLPPTVRTVYLMSARDGLAIERIAERLGMLPEEAARALAVALAELDRIIGSP